MKLPIAAQNERSKMMLMTSSPPAVASLPDLVPLPGGGTRPRSRSLVIGPGAPSPSSGDRAAQQALFGGLVLGGGCVAVPTLSSDRYKTEMCRSFAETGGNCRYGDRCQFAHGPNELRSVDRHPRYKTELCRTFHSRGFCAYGPRCHFIHNVDEMRLPASSVLEQMILQRQMADVMLLNQLAAASPVSSPPSSALFASSTAADNHRRLSLDNYVRSSPTPATCMKNSGKPEAASLVRDARPLWLTRQKIPDLSSSTQVFTASYEEELFRARSMSLGSAASRSMESGSGSSSPGPSSPTNAAGLSNNRPWAGVVRLATTVFDDSRQWFETRSPSTSLSVPDSPTSLGGSEIVDVVPSSTFYSSLCRQSSPPNRVISFDKQSPYGDGRRQVNHDQIPPNFVAAGGCGDQQRVLQMWPTC